MDGVALVLAPGAFRTDSAKTAHGLVRGSERFEVVAVLDADAAGHDAGELLDGNRRDIPVFASLQAALDGARRRPDTCIVGVATPGGIFPPPLRALLLEAVRVGLTLVNGLHQLLADDPEIAGEAARSGARLVDVRRPRPVRELHFWTGAIAFCALVLQHISGADGVLKAAATMWRSLALLAIAGYVLFFNDQGRELGVSLLGETYGILDAVINDFVSGELEHAVVSCDRAESPDLIVIEGQSSLRNPSGPCGAELLVSCQSRAAILQHAPGRSCYRGRVGWPLAALEEEVALIRLYGAEVLAVTLSGEGMSAEALVDSQRAIGERLGLPVVRPLEEGVGVLVHLVRAQVEREGRPNF